MRSSIRLLRQTRIEGVAATRFRRNQVVTGLILGLNAVAPSSPTAAQVSAPTACIEAARLDSDVRNVVLRIRSDRFEEAKVLIEAHDAEVDAMIDTTRSALRWFESCNATTLGPLHVAHAQGIQEERMKLIDAILDHLAARESELIDRLVVDAAPPEALAIEVAIRAGRVIADGRLDAGTFGGDPAVLLEVCRWATTDTWAGVVDTDALRGMVALLRIVATPRPEADYRRSTWLARRELDVDLIAAGDAWFVAARFECLEVERISAILEIRRRTEALVDLLLRASNDADVSAIALDLGSRLIPWTSAERSFIDRIRRDPAVPEDVRGAVVSLVLEARAVLSARTTWTSDLGASFIARTAGLLQRHAPSEHPLVALEQRDRASIVAIARRLNRLQEATP